MHNETVQTRNEIYKISIKTEFTVSLKKKKKQKKKQTQIVSANVSNVVSPQLRRFPRVIQLAAIRIDHSFSGKNWRDNFPDGCIVRREREMQKSVAGGVKSKSSNGVVRTVARAKTNHLARATTHDEEPWTQHSTKYGICTRTAIRECHAFPGRSRTHCTLAGNKSRGRFEIDPGTLGHWSRSDALAIERSNEDTLADRWERAFAGGTMKFWFRLAPSGFP